MERNKRLVAAGVGALVLVGVIAGGTQVLGDDDADDSDPGGGAGAAAGAIVADDLAFTPGRIEVVEGRDLEFRNEDGVAHTFTADEGLFDSGTVEAGGTFRFAFDGPRTVSYHCEIHPSMTGTIEVTEP